MQAQFPKTSITTLRGTRQKMASSDFDSVYKWTYEYDLEESDDDATSNDFVDIWNSDGKMPIFYKLVNRFLLTLKYDNEEDKRLFNSYVKEILKHGAQFGFTRIIIIEQLLEQVASQYATMQLFPVASKAISNDIFLYHGGNFLKYHNFLTLPVNTLFEVPIFMSTSLLYDIACRFAGTSKIIVRIVVKVESLSKFKYSFFGNTLDLQTNTSYAEHEILLNLYTKLKFKSVTTNVYLTYKELQINGSLLTRDGFFTIIDMEFVGNSSKTPQEVMDSLRKQSKRLLASSSGKKKKKSHIKHVAVKFKQSNKLYKKKISYTRKKGKPFTS
jgi:hypothetical protein